jgi:hypothetical protein
MELERRRRMFEEFANLAGKGEWSVLHEETRGFVRYKDGKDY